MVKKKLKMKCMGIIPNKINKLHLQNSKGEYLFHADFKVMLFFSTQKYLDHVLLHTSRLTAAQNTEQLIVRNEEKTWESVPLGIKVIIKTLLTPLQTIA